VTLQEQIRSNRLRTALVLLGFAALVALLVASLSLAFQPGIVGMVGIAAIAYGVFSWFFADRMVAAAAGARKITVNEAPELFRSVENAAIGAGLTRTPDVYLIDDSAPNAFAAGKDPEHAYVAATTGLLAILDRRELDGVVAHEIAHVRNRDVRLMSLAAVLVGVIALVCDLLLRMTIWGGMSSRDRNDNNPIAQIIAIVALILAPIGAALLQMTLSRRREYLADASAAEITGDAEGLARALAKLRDDKQPLRTVTRATAHLYIESPLRDNKGLRSSLGGLFDTHPPLEERIRRLAELGGFPPP
jgi:heat shock protein HtpX